MGAARKRKNTANAKEEKKEREDASKEYMNEVAVTSAMKHFVQRLVVDEAACPYTKSADLG